MAPAVVAHDLHPEYLSTKYALERDGVEPSACSTTTRTSPPASPSTARPARPWARSTTAPGYGTDGTVWGGELLAGGLGGFERAGHLWPVRLPGGDAAIRSRGGWRARGCGRRWARSRDAAGSRRWTRRAGTRSQRCAPALASPVTTSMGRLFDAVAAICGVRSAVNYEGQAAMELEAAADLADRGAYPLPLDATAPCSTRARSARGRAPTLRAGVAPGVVAARFHNSVAARHREAPSRRRAAGSARVLSGGVFQNRLLLERTASGCGGGLRVLVPGLLPPNDGGISYGQAAVAAAQSAQSPTIGKWQNRAA